MPMTQGDSMVWQTHTVFNQPAPLMNSNLFLSDSALREP
jgi:putative acyl-CoA dehydrogenase